MLSNDLLLTSSGIVVASSSPPSPSSITTARWTVRFTAFSSLLAALFVAGSFSSSILHNTISFPTFLNTRLPENAVTFRYQLLLYHDVCSDSLSSQHFSRILQCNSSTSCCSNCPYTKLMFHSLQSLLMSVHPIVRCRYVSLSLNSAVEIDVGAYLHRYGTRQRRTVPILSVISGQFCLVQY